MSGPSCKMGGEVGGGGDRLELFSATILASFYQQLLPDRTIRPSKIHICVPVMFSYIIMCHGSSRSDLLLSE